MVINDGWCWLMMVSVDEWWLVLINSGEQMVKDGQCLQAINSDGQGWVMMVKGRYGMIHECVVYVYKYILIQ